jgi:hypothetical protein
MHSPNGARSGNLRVKVSGSRGPVMVVTSVALAGAVVALIVGLGWSSTAAGHQSAVASSSGYPCAPSHYGCTPQQVIATVRQLFEAAGATSAEAACVADIAGRGQHSVSGAWGPGSAGQKGNMIGCVGSENRLQTLAFHLPRVKGFDAAQSCTTSGRLIVPISGSPPPPKGNWDTMSAQALRAEGWRIARAPGKTVCVWGNSMSGGP